MNNWFKGKRVVFDSESDGLWFEAIRVHCLSCINLADPKDRIHVGPEGIDQAVQALCHDTTFTAAHNSFGHDFPLFRRLYPNIRIPYQTSWDTLILSRFANSRRGEGEGQKAPHSIDAWGKRFGIPKPVHEDWSVYSPEMKHRNEQDTYINFLVLKKLIQELKGFSKQSIQNELDLGVLLQEMHEAGFYLDQAKAFNLYIDAKKHADSFEEQIRHAFPKRSVLVREVSPKETKAGGFSKAQTKCLGDTYSDAVGGPFSLFEYEDFNIDSPSQRVARLLERGWKPTTFTKPSQTHPNGQPKFDADDLEHGDLKTLPKEALLIGKYLLCRSRERLASQWLDLVDSKGYVHGRITGLGAWSHRATHTNPNTANIPNIQFDDAKHPLKGLDGVFGWECRDCWVVDPRDADEDVILDADLTAIQLRAFAHLTEDMDYISLVSDPSVDMHNVHKEYLGGVPRASAKRWLYAFLLGAGNAKLGTLLGGDSKMGREAADLFMLKVPGVKKLKEQIIPVWVRQGFLVGLDGRRVPVPSFHLGLAAYLQSFEKIVIAHAMIRHIRWAKENEIPMQYRFWIHDQVVGTVPKDHADACGKAFVNIVNKVGTDLGSLCPLTAAYNTGMTWAEASH